jgi:hypothetical protein
VNDDIHDLNRALTAERRQPLPTRETRETQQLRDLRAVIHILAQAMRKP